MQWMLEVLRCRGSALRSGTSTEAQRLKGHSCGQLACGDWPGP